MGIFNLFTPLILDVDQINKAHHIHDRHGELVIKLSKTSLAHEAECYRKLQGSDGVVKLHHDGFEHEYFFLVMQKCHVDLCFMYETEWNRKKLDLEESVKLTAQVSSKGLNRFTPGVSCMATLNLQIWEFWLLIISK